MICFSFFMSKFVVRVKLISVHGSYIYKTEGWQIFNPLNAKLNPVCYLVALLGAHHFLHVSRIRVKSLTLRLLMSYIYIHIYIYDISNLRVNTSAHCSGRKQVKG